MYSENQFVENLSAGFYLIALSFALLSAVRKKKIKKERIRNCLLSFFSLIFFFEETSFLISFFPESKNSVPIVLGVGIDSMHDLLMTTTSYFWESNKEISVLIITCFVTFGFWMGKSLMIRTLGFNKYFSYIICCCLIISQVFDLLVNGHLGFYIAEETLELYASFFWFLSTREIALLGTKEECSPEALV